MEAMDRRNFMLRSATMTGGLLLGAGTVLAQEKGKKEFIPYENVDESLFRGINKAGAQKDTALEKKHVPVIELPEKVKKGEPFPVKVTVGEIVHPMSQAHYIHDVELFAGNEPIGRMTFSPTFSQPQAVFNVVLDKPVTLVAREYCNLHGLWENSRDVPLTG